MYRNRKKLSDIFNTIFQLKVIKNCVQYFQLKKTSLFFLFCLVQFYLNFAHIYVI